MAINIFAKETFPHNELLREQQGYISANPLPNEIKKQITGWNLGYGKYIQAKTQESADKTYDKIKSTSYLIADSIQDWVEKDLPEQDDQQNFNQDSVQIVDGKNVSPDKKNDDKKPEEKKETDDDDSGIGVGGVLLGIGVTLLALFGLGKALKK
jgi:hypothetical protein